MNARLACILLPLITCASALAGEPPRTMIAPPSFEAAVEVNVVNVDVRVTDPQGKPVTGLRERDFELLEDGKRVDISNFAILGDALTEAQPANAEGSEETGTTATAEEGWDLVVYVDNFDLHAGSRARALRQLRESMGRLLAPGDRVMVVSYDQGLKIRLPFSSDPAAIAASLKELEGLAAHGTSIDLQRQQAVREIMTIQEQAVTDPRPQPCPLRIAKPAHDFAEARRDEVLRTLGALTVLVNSLSGVPGHKAVLHVSDGIPATPGEEVFQFLAEICGGGGGTGGIGRQASASGESAPPESQGDSGEEGARRGPLGRVAREPSLDPMAVYDSATLGPGAYKASSQAPLDAAAYNVGKELNALVSHANTQRVTLYTLQASGAERPAASDAGAGPGDRLFQFPSIETAQRASLQGSLSALASGTGGRAILDVNDFGQDLARMRQDFVSYYSLGFVPEHKESGHQHRLEVRVKRRGVQLRYRESYRDKTALERAADRTLAALFYGIEDNPMNIALEVGEQTPGPAGSFAVPVLVKIPLAKVAVLKGDGVYEGNLRLLVTARGADGRLSPLKQIPVPIRIPHREVMTALGQLYVYTLTLQLPPGEQRVAVGVRDDVSANTSYLSRAVTVGTAAAITPP